MNKLPKTRTQNFVVQETANELLVYDLITNIAFCLNQTAALVYELSDGTRTIRNISDEMSKRMKTLISEEMVMLALGELERNNLIENSVGFFAGVSRRELMKKVGLTSMAALPIISALAAPKAVAASSNRCSGICIPAGNNICATCTGPSATVNFYTSTDGSCSGADVGSSSGSCPGPFTNSRDACLVGVC